jgi:hypothetical protein
MSPRMQIPPSPPPGFAPCPRCDGTGRDVYGAERGELLFRHCTRCGGGGLLASSGPHSGPPYVPCPRCNGSGEELMYIERAEPHHRMCLKCGATGFKAAWRV